jgi:hypothetical protein
MFIPECFVPIGNGHRAAQHRLMGQGSAIGFGLILTGTNDLIDHRDDRNIGKIDRPGAGCFII